MRERLPGGGTLDPTAARRLSNLALGTSIISLEMPQKRVLPPLPAELNRPSDSFGVRAILRVVGPMVLLLAVAPWLTIWLTPWINLLIAVLLGAQIHKLTILMHDCSHNTLFSRRRWNQRIGRACALLLASDFRTFTRIHWQHHQEYGRPGDPQGRDYMGLQDASKVAVLWHLIRPLFGYNLFKIGDFQDPHAISLGKERGLRARAVTLGGIALLQVLIALLATDFGRVWWLIFLYPVSAATMALFYSQTRGFCEHVAPSDAQSESFVRTHVPNLIDKIFFYDLNFNYHVEHHYYPGAPSCHLPAIHERIRDDWHTEYTISPSIFATLYKRLATAGT